MRPILLALIALLAAPAAQAQVGIDLFRSLSGALRGGKEPQAQQQGATPVMGVRGIEETGTQAAAPSTNDNLLMEGWAATRIEAEQSAAQKNLVAQPARLRDGKTP